MLHDWTASTALPACHEYAAVVKLPGCWVSHGHTQKFLKFFLSPQPDGPLWTEETKLAAIRTMIFHSIFFYGPECQRGTLSSMQTPDASVPKSGNLKDLQKYSTILQKSRQSAYSAKHHPESAEGRPGEHSDVLLWSCNW